jgi:hypothetical protein
MASTWQGEFPRQNLDGRTDRQVERRARRALAFAFLGERRSAAAWLGIDLIATGTVVLIAIKA